MQKLLSMDCMVIHCANAKMSRFHQRRSAKLKTNRKCTSAAKTSVTIKIMQAKTSTQQVCNIGSKQRKSLQVTETHAGWKEVHMRDYMCSMEKYSRSSWSSSGGMSMMSGSDTVLCLSLLLSSSKPQTTQPSITTIINVNPC